MGARSGTFPDTAVYGEEETGAAKLGGKWSAGSVNQKFTGKERDPESGLDYFGARYYGSGLGRFTSADPLFFQEKMLADPQRFNLYSYVRNSPLALTDPTGEKMRLIGDEDDRQRELAAIQSAIGKSATVSAKADDKGDYYVAISGDTANGAAKNFASIIGNDETANFSLVSKYQSLAIGDGPSLSQIGAVGATGRDRKGQLWVYVQRDAISNVPASQFDLSKQDLATSASAVLFGVFANRATETGHEFGHALYRMLGGRAEDPQNTGSALKLENEVRQIQHPGSPQRVKEK